MNRWTPRLVCFAASSGAFLVIAWVWGAAPVQAQFVAPAAKVQVVVKDAPTVAADAPKPPAPTPSRPVLHLANGGFAAGTLEPSAKPGGVRWRAAGFTEPFDFPTAGVVSIHWPAPAENVRPEGELSFDLAGGDLVFGRLIALDQKHVEIDSPRIGRLSLDRSSVKRILRWRDAGDLVYVGPNGLSGWKDKAPEKEKAWTEESGQLVTAKEGATIASSLSIPARAAIEFELSWTKKPDFRFAVGVGDSPASEKRAFRFETWGNELIIQREVDQDADLAVVQTLPEKAGRIQLQAYLDQESGELVVYSREGKRLAELKLKSKVAPIVAAGVELVCLHGDLRLEWLRISRWSGEPPRELQGDQSRIDKQDGSGAYGEVVRYDATANELVFRDKKGESNIPFKTVAGVNLDLKTTESPRDVRAVYHDGTRLSGSIKRIESGAIILSSPGVAADLKLPLAGLRSLLVQKHDEKPGAKESGVGRLEMEGLLLRGRLVDGVEKGAASCLVWQPLGSETASPLERTAAGRIVYRDPPPTVPVQNNGRGGVVRMNAAVAQPAGVGGMVVRFAQALSATSPAPAKSANPAERKALFLRDGDAVPAIIKSIDERGVTFTSSISTSTFVPNDKLKAVELEVVPPQAPIRLNKSKRDRLLTLPRMQKASPPTHLIRSTTGDYLRGRVVKLDDSALELEIHLETKKVPRDRIAQIIWLQPDDLTPNKKPPDAPKSGTRVQGQRHDGVRLTFLAEKVAAGAVEGKSDVLGPCKVAMAETDQILFGGGIEQQAAKAAYQQWKLTQAVEPKFVNASDGGADTQGAESPLVDKPAPDFTLDLLDGKKFHLADAKGKIVMLDFWATWCGPCVQAMPQVEKVAGEFEKDGVTLVAVNLQEAPEQIKSMLERHKFKVTVALDREGLVADKYKAVAIPQTVIIDREGKVARLFVGGGTHFDDQLRQALKGVISGVKPAAAPANPNDDAKPAVKPTEL